MKDIATVVSVAGENAYFEFAEYSIPSFLRNNVTTDLFVFTDDVARIKKLGNSFSDKLHVVDLAHCFRQQQDMVKKLETKGTSDEEMASHTERYGFLHHHIFVSALLPIAEYYLKDNGKYSHILKIDIDGYFAGGDMMTLVREDIKSEDHDLFLVERKHPFMELYGGGSPGVGFTLWRKGSNFIPEYVSRYSVSEQITILSLRKKKIVKSEILIRPGYHFVRPFWKNKDITKDMLEEFLPAYFHLHGIHCYKNMMKLEDWFNV